jgi:catechol 2,3-dioxygenase-like lactoylglutathione lyase family enzyme
LLGPLLTMFDHLSITASDLDRAQTVYDAVLAPLGVPRAERRHVDGTPCYLSVYLGDDGPPGIREIYSPDYHAAFVRDPDGNRLEAVTRRPEEQR